MKRVFIFVLGAAVGSLVTWKLVEKKYKKIADEEIASVTEYYHNKLNALDLENSVQKVKEYDRPIEQPEEIKFYADGVEVGRKVGDEPAEMFTDEEREEFNEQTKEMIKELGYSEEAEATIKVILPKEYTKPYVISPDEFGEFGGMTASLTLYADGILADEDDEIITDPENVIGDALDHFGEYEDDAVHVRDEAIECDYEILRSEKTFDEVIKGDK